MLDLLVSVASGGATGLLGALFSGAMGVWKSKEAHKREIAIRRLDIEEMKQEAVIAESQMAHETEMAREQAESQARMASYSMASAPLYAGDSKLLQMADFIRALIRPTTLALLALFSIAIYFTSTADRQDTIAATILYLFSTAVVWYFGGRQLERDRFK